MRKTKKKKKIHSRKNVSEKLKTVGKLKKIKHLSAKLYTNIP